MDLYTCSLSRNTSGFFNYFLRHFAETALILLSGICFQEFTDLTIVRTNYGIIDVKYQATRALPTQPLWHYDQTQWHYDQTQWFKMLIYSFIYLFIPWFPLVYISVSPDQDIGR